MPTSDEILKQFREAQASISDSDPIKNELMARKLEALINEPHPEKSAQMAYDLLRDHSDSAMGVAVCQCMLNKPDGKKLATNVGRAITTAQLKEVTSSNGVESFLRGNSSTSTFSKQFISQTSPEYVNSIKQKAQQLAQKHDVGALKEKTEPERLQAMIDLTKDMKSLASNTDDLSPESKQYLSALNQGVQDDEGFAQRFSDSANVSLEQAQATQQRLGEIAINNSAALRFVMSELTTNPELAKNKYWSTCGNLAQNSFNLNGKSELNEKASHQRYVLLKGEQPPSLVNEEYTEAQNKCSEMAKQIDEAKKQGLDTSELELQKVELDKEFKIQENLLADRNNAHVNEATRPLTVGVHTEESRQEVTNMMTNLKEIDPPEGLGMDFEGEHQNTAAERKVNDENLTQVVQKDIAEQNLAKAIEPFDDHIKQLEARKQQLKENPTLKDKIKGFFNHGFKGVKGEIAKIDGEITATQTAKEDIKKGVSVADRRELVELMKEGLRANQTDIKQSLSQATKGGIEQINPGINFGVDNDQRNEAIQNIDDKKLAQKEMLAKLKTEQKVLSVREKLSMNQGSPKVEAPKTHHSVK